MQTAAEESFATATAYATYVGAGFVAVGVLGTVVGMRRRRDESDHGAETPAAEKTHSETVEAPSSTETTQPAQSSPIA